MHPTVTCGQRALCSFGERVCGAVWLLLSHWFVKNTNRSACYARIVCPVLCVAMCQRDALVCALVTAYLQKVTEKPANGITTRALRDIKTAVSGSAGTRAHPRSPVCCSLPLALNNCFHRLLTFFTSYTGLGVWQVLSEKD